MGNACMHAGKYGTAVKELERQPPSSIGYFIQQKMTVHVCRPNGSLRKNPSVGAKPHRAE